MSHNNHYNSMVMNNIIRNFTGMVADMVMGVSLNREELLSQKNIKEGVKGRLVIPFRIHGRKENRENVK